MAGGHYPNEVEAWREGLQVIIRADQEVPGVNLLGSGATVHQMSFSNEMVFINTVAMSRVTNGTQEGHARKR